MRRMAPGLKSSRGDLRTVVACRLFWLRSGVRLWRLLSRQGPTSGNRRQKGTTTAGAAMMEWPKDLIQNRHNAVR